MSDWIWKPFKRFCTVQEAGPKGPICGKPLAGGYKAAGGGYQELCAGHLKPHRSYSVTVEQMEAEKPQPKPRRKL